MNNKTYKVTMTIPEIKRTIDMPTDKKLSFKEASWRAHLYKTKNSVCIFNVVEEMGEEE